MQLTDFSGRGQQAHCRETTGGERRLAAPGEEAKIGEEAVCGNGLQSRNAALRCAFASLAALKAFMACHPWESRRRPGIDVPTRVGHMNGIRLRLRLHRGCVAQRRTWQTMRAGDWC